MGGKSPVPLLNNGIRCDGRKLDELRAIKIEAGVLKQANGSCYLEWGKNKILAAVHGPRTCLPKHESSPYAAKMKARYTMSPFSTEDHGRAGPNRRSTELSKVIRHIYENVVFTNLYPKSEIALYMEVLQADGSTRCAALTAGSVALANAGIQMRDLVVGVSVGKIEGELALDLKKEEDNFGQADVPLAIAARNKEILLFQMDGKLTREEVSRAMDMAIKSSDYVHGLQVEALKKAYGGMGEEEKGE